MNVGDVYDTDVCYSQDQVRAFAEISGDYNPLHLDEEYAATTPFGRRIIHGFLSASVFSRILGLEFPGEGTIILRQSLTFRAPLYVGVSYTVVMRVKEVIEDKHRAVMEGVISDLSTGKPAIHGETLIQNPSI